MKHNFPKGVRIVCSLKHNLLQGKEILKLAIDSDCVIVTTLIENIVNESYPYFVWDYNRLSRTTRNKETDPQDIYVSFEEFKAFLQGKGKYQAPFQEEIKLNDSYTAIVTKNNIKVGCQQFSHEIVKKLYQSSQKALKS